MTAKIIQILNMSVYNNNNNNSVNLFTFLPKASGLQQANTEHTTKACL